nr:DUF2065 domain-containing protein [Lysobacter sp. CAU 1642]
MLAALCLVLVIEGLFLLAGASAWKRMAAQMQEVPTGTLRIGGAILAGLGLLLLQWVRG